MSATPNEYGDVRPKPVITEASRWVEVEEVSYATPVGYLAPGEELDDHRADFICEAEQLEAEDRKRRAKEQAG